MREIKIEPSELKQMIADYMESIPMLEKIAGDDTNAEVRLIAKEAVEDIKNI